ncbi:DEAD/DEAH box helicase [Variovorax sp. J22R133]|uniref:DEAD/DEAH box helicase n=1 Tax=Variovorax brevis TaxID=3053503 RepID=UPI002576F97B|nr:DEAD/DEAH box helicase [Variovorax sp. J22R133]MDM0114722.1 DEAD/DEAH box helicase [Variovorax sp. J22R133]
MPFPSLGLTPALVHAATDVGYFTPTPIQEAAIPAVLRGQDVLGLAQTGSGKTAAFSLPLLQRWNEAPRHRSRRAVHTLVLVPTRELAAQVGETLRLLAQQLHERPKIAVVFGGVSVNPQMMALRGGADIVVATPGRLIDLLDHNALKLANVSALVLDEADRLLDLGFAEELQRILDVLPPKRQNLFFSATFAPAVEALATRLLHEPVRIEVEATEATEPDIAQRAIEVDAGRRTQLLRHLVQEQKWTRVLAFVATKHAAEIVADKLRKVGIDAEPFHGMLSQGKRTQVVSDFKASRVQVVVATDLAARGIDIAQLPVVVNYDLPRSASDYTHRIGRTGRAGESGLAVSFIPADSEAHFRIIEKRQGLHVPRERIAGFEPVEVAVPVIEGVQSPTGGIKGKRPSKKDKLRAAAARAAAVAKP